MTTKRLTIIYYYYNNMVITINLWLGKSGRQSSDRLNRDAY